MDYLDQILIFLQSYGYLGCFLIGLVGNALPFAPIPYLVPIFLIATVLNPFWVGLATGLGASLGKTISYVIGRAGGGLLPQKKQLELRCFSRLVGRYGAVAIFIFAYLPMPDDVVVIPFGMAKYSFPRFFLALVLGKLALGWTVAYAAYYSVQLGWLIMGSVNVIIVTVLSIFFMFLMMYIIYKIDWIEAAEYIDNNGVRAYLRLLVRRTFKRGS